MRCDHPATKAGAAVAASKLHIRAHQHGMNNGWFWWPWEFDPVWLISCKGYEATAEAGSTNDDGCGCFE